MRLATRRGFKGLVMAVGCFVGAFAAACGGAHPMDEDDGELSLRLASLPGHCITCDAPIPCGGFLARPCPAGLMCVDRPGDACDPAHGGADCPGICVLDLPPVPSTPDTTPIQCGGFAGLRCPDGLVCIDDPSDSCDPTMGGADCAGICV
jgi:hypothetical protein